MNSEHDQNLETQLTELTTWRGKSPQLWQSALRQSKQSRWSTFFAVPTWSLPKAIAASIALVLVSAIAIALITTSNDRSRYSMTTNTVMSPPVASNSLAIERSNPIYGANPSNSSNLYSAMVAEAALFRDERPILGMSPGHDSGGGSASADGTTSPSNVGQFGWSQTDESNPENLSDPQRQVIRKATIELTTNDVRAAFLKAMHLVSEAGGEYVQDSTLTGQDQNAQANFTMRIATHRLSEVLNELRALGVVQSENLAGEDVTAQVIDLEARLRNEQRVETELLQLLEKRDDAPLKEVLELREQIARVRMRIETLTAQRERVSRLVSLATILVIIRTAPAPATQPEPPKKQTIGEYFSVSIASDWSAGLRTLAETLSGTLRVLMGGLFWWVGLIAALLVLRRHLQQRNASRLPA